MTPYHPALNALIQQGHEAAKLLHARIMADPDAPTFPAYANAFNRIVAAIHRAVTLMLALENPKPARRRPARKPILTERPESPDRDRIERIHLPRDLSPENIARLIATIQKDLTLPPSLRRNASTPAHPPSLSQGGAGGGSEPPAETPPEPQNPSCQCKTLAPTPSPQQQATPARARPHDPQSWPPMRRTRYKLKLPPKSGPDPPA